MAKTRPYHSIAFATASLLHVLPLLCIWLLATDAAIQPRLKPPRSMMVATVALKPAHAKPIPQELIAEAAAPQSNEPQHLPESAVATAAESSPPVEAPKPQNNTSKESKAQKKPLQKKPAQKAKRPAEQKKEKKPAATAAASAASNTKPSSNQKNIQKSLNEALAYLDSTASLKNAAPSSKSTASQKIIGTLACEDSSAGSDDRPSSDDEWYVQDLIRRLQLHVRLQEPGMVRLVLTISSNGAFQKVSIISGSSAASKNMLEKALAQIQYAPFGRAFSKKKAQSFRLKLEDDGSWGI